MTSESDMRADGAFAADGFDFAFFGIVAFDADVLSAAGFEAFAAGCAAAFFAGFFRGFFRGFFVGMRFSQTTGLKTYTVLP